MQLRRASTRVMTAKKNLEIEHHCNRTEHTVQVKFITESYSLDIGHLVKQS